MKIVLAFSGGLDTTAVVARYTDEGHQVVAVYGELGQPGDADLARSRAEQAGAIAFECVDLREDFADEYLSSALRANARYEGRYPLVSALSRPAIAEALVDMARRYDADACAHGCTGKGNDQVRFEVSLRGLAPDLDVLAPIRDWKLTRPDAFKLLEARRIEVDAKPSSPYSIDENIWGRSCEAGVLEDAWQTPPADAYEWTVDPAEAPHEPTEIIVGFEGGIATSINGEPMSLLEILIQMNEIGGGYGFGRLDMIENRRIGIKSREIYEVPGALGLIEAHRDLEDLCLERDVLHEKAQLEQRWAELVYDGLWFSPLRRAIDAFIAETQAGLDGEVRLRYQPGTCTPVGRRSGVALYEKALATYDIEDAFAHHDSAGFVHLWGLPTVQWARVRGGLAHGWAQEEDDIR